MFCLACDYDLSGLAPGRCPECGRAFDPADPDSFGAEPGSARRARRAWRLEVSVVLAGAVPLAANLFAFAALLLARVSLGAWPPRGRWDGATSTVLMDATALVAAVLSLLTLPALLAMLLLLPFLATSDAPRRLARGAVLGGALWIAGLLLIRWDPARVWVWIFD